MSDDQTNEAARFSLGKLLAFVGAVCVCCALIPGAALIVVSFSLAAIGFLLSIFGDMLGRDWMALLGLVVLATGFVGGLVVVQYHASLVG